jgi:hypothetical protein
MGYIAIACDFVGSVNYHNALVSVVGKNAGHFPEHGSLAHARLAQHKNAFARKRKVFDNPDCAIHGTPDPESEANGLAVAIANGRYAMECTLYTSPVILAKRAYAVYDILNIVLCHLLGSEKNVLVQKAGFRLTPKVKNNFKKLVNIIPVL